MTVSAPTKPSQGVESSSAVLCTTVKPHAGGAALADALNAHWNTFLQEINYLIKGDVDAAKRLRQARKDKIEVNASVNEAAATNLTVETVKRTLKSFLISIRRTLPQGPIKWNLSHKYLIKPHRQSVIQLKGSFTFFDSSKWYTVSYSIQYVFYVVP